MPQPVKSIVVKEVQHDGTVITERPKFRSEQSFNSYLQRACVRVRLLAWYVRFHRQEQLFICWYVPVRGISLTVFAPPALPPWTLLSAVPP